MIIYRFTIPTPKGNLTKSHRRNQAITSSKQKLIRNFVSYQKEGKNLT